MTVDDPGPADGTGTSDALAELDRLARESKRRETELHELADAVPAAVSRTALLRSLLRDLGGGRRRRR